MGAGVGVVTGLLASLHIDSSAADNLPPLLAGAVSGWVYRHSPAFAQKVFAGFLIGVLAHGLWLGVRLRQDYLIGSWDVLAIQYALPMLISGAGVALFLVIIGDMRAQRERIERSELARALGVANRVLPTMVTGFDEAAATQIAAIVHRLTGAPAVAVAAPGRLLAHVGEAADYHLKAGFVPDVALQAMDDLERHTTQKRSTWCDHPGCPFGTAVAMPLTYEGRAVASLVLYQLRQMRFRPEVVDLAAEVGQFLVNYQMRVVQAETQAQAISRAELKALQAQVHPHFLFNALNTLAGLCEINPSEAGRLTVKLGEFFRSSLRSERAVMSSVREELDTVRAYLDIEKARFGERLEVVEETSRQADECIIPSFSLQPLVENAVVHGISRKPGQGVLRIVTRINNGHLTCFVADNGTGFPEGARDWAERPGHALPMLKGRLERIYGSDYRLRISSSRDKGTVVCLQLPGNQDE